MAIDTWKIQSDETQKFILRWLGEINDVLLDVMARTADSYNSIIAKTPLLKDAQEDIKIRNRILSHYDILRRFSSASAREVKLNEQHNEADSRES